MTINVPLLRKVLEHITAHPEEHDQEVWGISGPACGTKFCLAGHVVQATGHQLVWMDPLDWEREVYGAEAALAVVDDWRTVPAVATEELGLDADQEQGLFWEAQTLDDLWRLASEYTNGEITR